MTVTVTGQWQSPGVGVEESGIWEAERQILEVINAYVAATFLLGSDTKLRRNFCVGFAVEAPLPRSLLVGVGVADGVRKAAAVEMDAVGEAVKDAVGEAVKDAVGEAEIDAVAEVVIHGVEADVVETDVDEVDEVERCRPISFGPPKQPCSVTSNPSQ